MNERPKIVRAVCWMVFAAAGLSTLLGIVVLPDWVAGNEVRWNPWSQIVLGVGYLLLGLGLRHGYRVARAGCAATVGALLVAALASVVLGVGSIVSLVVLLVPAWLVRSLYQPEAARFFVVGTEAAERSRSAEARGEEPS